MSCRLKVTNQPNVDSFILMTEDYHRAQSTINHQTITSHCRQRHYYNYHRKSRQILLGS